MSDSVQIELVRGLAIAIPSIVAAIFSYLGLKQSKENGHQMNHRMDEMLEMKGKEGEQKERDRQREQP